MAETVIEFRDVVKIYNERPVLDGISFTVQEGEYVSITGESMSGKSTIFRLITGLIKPESGQVRLFGRDLINIDEREKRELLKLLEMQFQSGALFDSMSVSENIMFVLDEETSLPAEKKHEIIDRLLRGVNLSSAKNKHPHQLSGGMKKRVAVARALATTPKLALFDEPAAGLDPVTSVRIVNLIKSLVAEHDMTIMVATSDVQLAMRFSDRFIIIKDGKIHADRDWRELKADADGYTRKFLSRIIHS